MCSRYFVDDDIVCEIEKLVGEIDQEMRNRLTGDIYPSQNALVITAANDRSERPESGRNALGLSAV